MLSGLLIIKVAAIVIVLFTLSFLFYKRFNSKKKQSAQFRHNIGLLREEKLLMHTNKKVEKKRQKLLKLKISDEVNHKQLMNKSKKLGLPAGELLLAVKIQMSSK